ncbi:MAG: alpha/beta hydrolase [Candidatus Lokiarchaeota archaeon]|nr:alpha/beta hydrolase [Candidatus Lokiarchaeota archaeon]
MDFPEIENFTPIMQKYFHQLEKNLERRNIRSDVRKSFIKGQIGMIEAVEGYISKIGKENIKNELGIGPYEAFFKQDPEFMRRVNLFIIDTTPLPLPDNVHTEIIYIDKVPARWIVVPEAKTNNDHVLLHLHGGAYIGGSIRFPGNLIIPYRVANASNIPVLMLNYGLAPKRPFPIGLNDAVNAYKWLLSKGYKTENVIIWGESAGGGLTMATILKLRELKIPLPKAAVLLSPWVDLAFKGSTYDSRKDKDSVLTKEGLSLSAEMYLNGTDPFDPYVSPLYADLAGLPPLYVEVGDWEVFLDEDTQLAEKASKAGVDVIFNIYPEMPHVHQGGDLAIPEVQQSINQIAQFIRKQFKLTDN